MSLDVYLNPLKGRRAVATIRWLAARAGYDTVLHSRYSPIPSVPPAGAPAWRRRTGLSGIDWDEEGQLDFAERALAPHVGELAARSTSFMDGFPLLNPWYGPVDAESLYAMLRHMRPSRVLELGGGYSTLVICLARERNAQEGVPAEHVVIDPEPQEDVIERVAGSICLERRDAAGLPPERFLALDANDVLFVDTSHSVKRGGDVNHVVLEMLPLLRPGVVVHFHDIFLPYEYPHTFFARGTVITEQYLLQAYLSGNGAYEVLFAAHALARDRGAEFERIFPTLPLAQVGPAAFWMRRTDLP